MSFVERVVGHVRRVQQIAEGGARDKRVRIDYGRHEARLMTAVENTAGERSSRLAFREELWAPNFQHRWIEELHWALIAGSGAGHTLEERSDLVDLGLAIAAGIDEPVETTIVPAWREAVARVVGAVGQTLRAWRGWSALTDAPPWTDVIGYCRELGLVVEHEGNWTASAAGQVLMRLRGLGSVRWLLALEVAEAIGRLDPWRVDAETLARVLEVGDFEHRWAEEGEFEVIELPSVERLGVMGVLDVGTTGQGYWWRLTAPGREIISEVLDQGRPMPLMARAIRGDDVDRVMGTKDDAGVAEDSRINAMVRHARMVAHEVRNALGPVQHAAFKLRGELSMGASSPLVLEQLGAIDGGVSRLYRFVTESVRLVPPESLRVESFSVLEAIAEARKELGPEGIGSLTIETVPVSADPRCQGNRGQFVMAMLNVLRNAQQAAGHDVRIAIRIDARDPAQIHLSIEDDGPGVPDAVREHIFENGVSYREDGTGHGLASLRAVVEDIGGKVRCTTSELGGAKFEIMLPAVEESP